MVYGPVLTRFILMQKTVLEALLADAAMVVQM